MMLADLGGPTQESDSESDFKMPPLLLALRMGKDATNQRPGGF